MVIIYNARGMSGRIKAEVVHEAAQDKEFLEKAGFTVLCPVEKEGIACTMDVLQSTKNDMKSHWPKDKQMIREAHVVFDNSPHMNSEGVKHEIGYARYFLFKPIIRIYPENRIPPLSSVAYFEDDYICDNLIDAMEYVLRVHGTPLKRLKWKLKLFNKCFLNYILIRFNWLWNWI